MTRNLLDGKKILLGVTGSIAIYKSLELIRLFIKAGAKVKVIMSEEAKRFITSLTFEAISQNEVLHVKTESWSNELNHIHSGKWADIFVIAPISVNTINKLSHGIADNLLTQTVIAFNKPIVIAPSANTNMMLNPITKESLAKLQTLGYTIVAPQTKLLACNDEGMGALADVEKIFYKSASLLLEDAFWKGREVIITGGGTVEKIDDVRCLSNFSSGKQAAALALAFYLKGAKVSLITSSDITLDWDIQPLHVKSSLEMKEALVQTMQKVDTLKIPYLFMAAAVSDFVPKAPKKGKMKKEELGNSLCLELVANEDILANLDKKGFKVIGFKAEMDTKVALQNAQKMLTKKGLNAVCLNIIDEQNNFGSSNNAISFISQNEVFALPLASKFEIAQKIVELSKHL